MSACARKLKTGCMGNVNVKHGNNLIVLDERAKKKGDNGYNADSDGASSDRTMN